MNQAITQPAHAKLSASSMERWSKCPGSIKLSEGIPSTTSKYAAEGTLAHEWAAVYLNNVFAMKAPTPEYEIFWDKTTEEMREAVRVYTDYVLETIKSIDNPRFLVEYRFDLSSIYPGLFGTSDCVIYDAAKKTLHVIDYKHGAGIAVEVENNPQLLYYALGAILNLKGFPAEKIQLTVVQPRCLHEDKKIRHHIFDAIAILDFAADLVEFAKATEKIDAPLVSGDHCRFCPAQFKCPEIVNKATRLAQTEFGVIENPPTQLQPTQTQSLDKYLPTKQLSLKEALDFIPRLKSWIEATEEYAYNQILKGQKVEGYKLVNKRATRKWSDHTLVETALSPFIKNKMDLYKTELLSPAQIEKVLKSELKTLPECKAAFEDLVVAESSGFTLALESDPRLEAKIKISAAEEFSVVEEIFE